MIRTLAISLLLVMGMGFYLPGTAPAASYLESQGLTLMPTLTTAGNPADYVVYPSSFFDGVAQLEVGFSTGGFSGSAALLTGGQYLLTAAHMVKQGGSLPISLTATFYLAGGPLSLAGAQYFVHPGWTGDINDGNDIALIRLAAPAPITGYQIYRDPDTVGVVADLAGYGLSGTGLEGNILDGGILRQGKNRYDTYWGLPGLPYAFDFDDGSPARDTFGNRFGLHDQGTGLSEVFLAFGDSGGPGFINGKIAGVHSFIGTYGQPDDSNEWLDSTFGEVAGDTRVAAYAGWIDGVVPIPGTLVLLASGLAGLLAWGRRRGRGRGRVQGSRFKVQG